MSADPPADAAAAAAAEASARLSRLTRYSTAALSQLGAMLRAGAIQSDSLTSDADAAVEGAQMRAGAASLVASVEGLLALVLELKLDAAMAAAAAAAPPAEQPALQ